MTVEIRGILLSDKRRIVEIIKATGVFQPEEIEIAEEMIDEHLDGPAGSAYHFYVAEHEGRVEGCVCYGATPLTQGTWDVYWIAVSPESTGKGIGGTLLRFAEDDIRRQGGRMVLTDTSSEPRHRKARSLYVTRGYDLISTIPDFYSPGDNRVTFSKVF